MNRLFHAICFVSCFGISELSSAQYFQYSQYNFTEQRINPAMTGRSRYASASLDSRDQKTGGDFSIRSNFLELAYPLLNSSTGQPWSGVGITLHDDRSGGIFQTQEASLSYAVHMRVAKFQTFSLGMKVLYASRNVNLDGFYTGSQYVPDRGFSGVASSGENFYGYRNAFVTFSSGLYWEQTDLKGRRLHHLGFSFFDMNRPADSFMNSSSRLSSTFIMEGGIQAYSANDIHIFPEALLTFSAATTAVNAGVRIQKEFNIKPKQPSDRIELLARYAVGRSGILGMQLHREKFSVGLSYDFPLLESNAGNLGALEVGLTVRRLVSTHAQKVVARRKKAADERKKVMAARKQELAKRAKPVVNQKASVTEPGAPIAPVVIDTLAASDVEATASAGLLKQEPLMVEKVTLHFSFDFNSTDLDPDTEKFLSDLAGTLIENKNLHVHIMGYTDNIGSEKFNLRLSQKRADAVSQYLSRRGIQADRIKSEGRGMKEPLNANQTDAERALNRRVVITVSY